MITEKTDRKKEAILDAAEKLFAAMGFDGASTRSIAAEAAVNMAMLSYYFGSKEGVFKAVLERRLGVFRQSLEELNDKDISSWEKLETCIDMYTDRIMADNCFSQLIHRELTLPRTEMAEFITDSLLANANEVRRIINEGIANGTFRAVDTEFTVASIFGTKYYIANASLLASKLFGKDLRDPLVIQEIKPRIKKHLHDLLKAHLTKHDIKA
ncbi:TetR/AcrR family transcriptional regulator [Hufsiella ginkgonis]|uniref:TetR family transcriptional regulator n=1 Tax=Hufsiella ginkgonis TaxID=2695274 RepID=A0A7K1XTM3_9SPHI|nr:TetR/AcrR family transcriptional regulator [Hufsiella ginkgonis]MXV14363.1 TetR family transcriptional regulator [Hufsiella ginkgonis]